MKPAHPEVEFVWIMTESAADTAKFAKQIGFNWRAIEYESTGSMPHVNEPINGLLPQLIVMDPNGRVLANGWQNSAQNALRQLDALLKAPPRQPWFPISSELQPSLPIDEYPHENTSCDRDIVRPDRQV